MKLLFKWLLSAAALLLVAHFYSGVQVQSFTAALVASLVIGLLNTVLRPVLVVLFLFVVNALVFWSASGLLVGFHVSGFAAALIGSLLYSALGIAIDSVV
jgi:putative membrane protein